MLTGHCDQCNAETPYFEMIELDLGEGEGRVFCSNACMEKWELKNEEREETA